MKSIILGGGCFWCTEAVFKGILGVKSVMPGYAGGTKENPTYKEVCSGSTGHAEVIKLEYDPGKLQLDKVLELFFMSHDPTSADRQGNDVGTQYRSIIIADKADIPRIKSFISSLDRRLEKPVVTELKSEGTFYPAEEHHRDYYAKHRLQPYCMLVIAPKLKKLQSFKTI